MMVTTQLSGVSRPFSLRFASRGLFGIVLSFNNVDALDFWFVKIEWIRSSCAGRRAAEFDCRDNAEHDEQRQYSELRELERRFGLCWRNFFECRNFHESLHNSDEDVEIEGNYGADDEDFSPGAGKMTGVARVDRNRQHYQRQDAYSVGGHKVVNGKKEPGHARRHGGRQKQCRPAVEPFPGEEPEQDNESREYSHQTYCYVDQGIDCQNHSFVFVGC